MTTKIGVVSSSSEGYRITFSGERMIEKTFASGIHLAEAYARQLIELEDAQERLTELHLAFDAIPRPIPDWEKCFKDLEAAVKQSLNL